MIAELSPFDERGLGAWYWLKNIERVDEIYLFLRRAAFLASTGVSGGEAHSTDVVQSTATT